MNQWSRPSGGFSADLRGKHHDWQWHRLHYRASPSLPSSLLVPLILILLDIPQEPSKIIPTGKKKTSPQNAYWYLDHMIPEPSTCLCPLCPPSPSRVTVRKDWWYPVLTLYLGAVVLNSLFLRNMQHSVGSLRYMFSSCLWPWGDVFSCRKTPNLPLWPLQIMLNSSPNCSRTETWLGRSKGSIIKSPSTRQIPVLPACLVMFFSSLKKSFLLNRHLHSGSENGGWEA